MAIRTFIVVAAIAAVGGVATFDAVRGGHEPGPGETAVPQRGAGTLLTGVDAPAPGALPGTLVVETAGACRPGAIDLPRLRLGRLGPATSACGIWVSRGGNDAVVRLGPAAGIRLLQLGPGPPRLGRTLGPAVGEPSWSPTGDLLAQCTPRGDTVVRSLSDGRSSRLAGCEPRFGADGSILTRPDGAFARTLLRDGAPFLSERDLERSLPPDARRLVAILGFDARGGAVAALLVGVGRDDFVQRLGVWRGRRLERSVELARAPRAVVTSLGDFGLEGKVVRLGPDAREAAVASPGGGARVLLVDLGTGRRVLLPPQWGFSWSPDGAWLAVAGRDEILFYGAERSEYVYALPLAIRALAWGS